MEVFPYTIEYYLTKKGEKPFKEWLDRLKDVSARQKVRIRLDRVRLGGLGKNRSVGSGVSELKIDYGPGSFLSKIGFSPQRRRGRREDKFFYLAVRGRQIKSLSGQNKHINQCPMAIECTLSICSRRVRVYDPIPRFAGLDRPLRSRDSAASENIHSAFSASLR